MKTAEQLIEELDIQDLATFMESAEFDQLDEISVKTLTKYIGKASKDRTKSAYKALDHGLGKSRRDYSDDDADYDADIAKKRAKGIDTAVKKLVKKTGFENARDRHYADWDGAEKVPAPKRESIEDYTLEELQDFVMSEDFEQLDELSKTTLLNYSIKASKNMDQHNKKSDEADQAAYSDNEEDSKVVRDFAKVKNKRGMTEFGDDDDEHDPKQYRPNAYDASNYHAHMASKRKSGMAQAAKKLTKESIESMVSAILDGDDEASSVAFQQAMGEKITDNMDAMKIEIAGSIGEERLDELSNSTLKSYMSKTGAIDRAKGKTANDDITKEFRHIQNRENIGRSRAKSRISAREKPGVDSDAPSAYKEQGKEFHKAALDLLGKHQDATRKLEAKHTKEIADLKKKHNI